MYSDTVQMFQSLGQWLMLINDIWKFNILLNNCWLTVNLLFHTSVYMHSTDTEQNIKTLCKLNSVCVGRCLYVPESYTLAHILWKSGHACVDMSIFHVCMLKFVFCVIWNLVLPFQSECTSTSVGTLWFC